FLSEVSIRRNADDLAGRKIGDIAVFKRSGLRIVGLRSGGGVVRANLAERVLKKGDTLIVFGTTSELLTLNDDRRLRIGSRRGTGASGDAVVVEAVVAPLKASVGQRIADLTLGRRYGVRI